VRRPERFLVFRSHWGFEAEFCNPEEAHVKGGVEGEGGYLRRNHFVPLPHVRDLADLKPPLTRQLQGGWTTPYLELGSK
jgi:transposase